MNKNSYISVNTIEFRELSEQIGNFAACVLIIFTLSGSLTFPPVFNNKTKCRRDELFRRIAMKLFSAQPAWETKRTVQAIEALVNEGYITVKKNPDSIKVELNKKATRYLIRKEP